MNKKIPVLIVNDWVVFPDSEYRIETNNKYIQNILNVADEEYDRELLLIHSLDGETLDDVTQFPSIGLVCEQDLKIMVPNSKMRSVLLTKQRVHIDQYEEINGIYYAEITPIENTIIDVEIEKVYCNLLQRSYHRYVREIPTVSNAMLTEIFHINSLSELTDTLVKLLPLTVIEQKDYLYEISPIARADKLLEQLRKEIEISKLENKIEDKVRAELDEEQKKYYLREKMKVISEELGDEHSKNGIVTKYYKKLKQLKCSPSIKERIKEEIAKYESSSNNSPDISMIKDYIEWMLSLPWNHDTKDTTSMVEIERILNENHYGMKEVKERILEYIAVKQNTKSLKGPILCLIGPPGVGKTSLAYSIAKSLNRKLATISVGGINDEAEIVGHRRTYVGALPGKIIQGMKKAGSSNPVFVIDEIDKMTKNIKGDPASSLLEVLDPEQNAHFSDHYIEEPFDLSKVLFIATANYEEQIPMELKDRLEIIHIPSYTEYEKVEIAENYLIPKALEEHGLTSLQVQFDKKAILHIIEYYTKEAGVRDLQRLIAKILRKIVKNNLLSKTGYFGAITEAKVEKYLGKKIYLLHDNPVKYRIGVVNGLAYTPFGGDILPIEVTHFAGKGELILTGSLGDVMKESAYIALSYIKANQRKFGISPNKFKDDIHIHVPEGAVMKDGPSAGVSLTTSLISSLSGVKVSSKIAMTGEITLQGDVLAIGGLREKALGAYRAGITTIYLPKENESDVLELPKEIKKKIEFVYVENYIEIANQLFLKNNLPVA